MLLPQACLLCMHASTKVPGQERRFLGSGHLRDVARVLNVSHAMWRVYQPRHTQSWEKATCVRTTGPSALSSKATGPGPAWCACALTPRLVLSMRGANVMGGAVLEYAGGGQHASSSTATATRTQQQVLMGIECLEAGQVIWCRCGEWPQQIDGWKESKAQGASGWL